MINLRENVANGENVLMDNGLNLKLALTVFSLNDMVKTTYYTIMFSLIQLN